MGFHVITKNEKGNLESHYTEKFMDIANIPDLNDDCIIYKGEPHWTPCRIGDSDIYKHFAEDWFRAGIKAQRLFWEQATAHGLIVEEISQEKETMKAYVANAKGFVKRGDYIVRNANHAEVEIKCLTFYKRNDIGEAIYLPYGMAKDHERMEHCTNSKVIFAIYRRNGDQPDQDSLRTIMVEKVLRENRKGGAVSYDEDKKVLIIPVSLTEYKFNCFDVIMKR